MENEFLNLSTDQSDDDDSQSKTEILGHYMSGLGFSAKEPKVKDTLEYYKSYVDPTGRVGRVVIVIKKDAVGLEPEDVDYATITMQMHLNMKDEDIEKAPGFCKADLQRVRSHFMDLVTRFEEAEECGHCGALSTDYQVHDFGQGPVKACLDCVRRDG